MALPLRSVAGFMVRAGDELRQHDKWLENNSRAEDSNRPTTAVGCSCYFDERDNLMKSELTIVMITSVLLLRVLAAFRRK